MSKGWIKMHREFLDWEWYGDINVKVLFLHLLIKANFEDKKWRGIAIKRGQFLTSLDVLSKETGLSIQQVRTALKKLISTGEITSKSTSKNTIISIEKYDFYQNTETEQQANNKQITSKQQANNKQVTTTKEYNNIKNVKEHSKSTNISALPISDTSGSVYSRCMDLYNQFVIEVTGVKPNITAITGKSLKGIIKYLDGMTGKNPEKTTQALEYIFANYHLWDTFHQKNLKMEAILSNIVNIIKSIKDGREKPQQQQQSVDDWASTIENLTSELRENGGYEENSVYGLMRKRTSPQR